MKSEQVVEKNKQAENTHSKLWLLVSLLSLAILFTLAYKFKDVLKPKVDTIVAADEHCDLRKNACTTILPKGGNVTFFIDPIDIPLLKPLALSVELDGIEPSKVEVDFVGIGMEMGYNRSLLKANVESTNTTKKYSGKAILPVCSLAKMNWEARVLLHTEDGLIAVPFLFYTLK
ncbi:MAG: hypothetical protein V3V19_02690 [Cocleimonas sp.]